MRRFSVFTLAGVAPAATAAEQQPQKANLTTQLGYYWNVFNQLVEVQDAMTTGAAN
jgi:hypothetical protein